MRRAAMWIVVVVTVGGVTMAASAVAQTGDGSLRGYIKDEQGGVLPGVTVTATSPALLAPVTTVTDSDGYYRLLNLPPGTYTLTAELPGFATFRREGILMRAGLTLAVDITMRLGGIEETIVVSGESPMIEVGRPTSTLNIEGELVRAAPVTSRRLFSDVLDMTPGVNSRNVDDGLGRRAYYFHGSHIYAHAFQLEGAPASSYNDAAAHSMGMGGDVIQDVELKLGGVDAASPLGTGVVMNVVTPRGGNRFSGSVSYQVQPLDWNADNTQKGIVKGGLPTFQKVNQWDLSLGGPVLRDRVWFFSSYRYADLANGISRTEQDLALLKAFRPDFVPFHNVLRSHQPFVKLTTQLGPKHELSGYFQNDRNRFTRGRERQTHQVLWDAAGGSLWQAKLTSVWTNRLTTQVMGSYNNKGGSDEVTFGKLSGAGPMVRVFERAVISRGVPTGAGGRLVDMNNVESVNIAPGSMLVFRGDLTYFREGWGGSHEFKTGIWAAPRLWRDIYNRLVNDGFTLEEVRMRDPGNPAAGLVAFHRVIQTPVEVHTVSARDRDIGVYVQDSWKPHPRLTANLGVRVDFIRRRDAIFDFDRMKTVAVGPRFGASYLVTRDARNVLRAFAGRIHEQVNGRDPVTTFGPTSRRFRRDLYDADGDGIFETEVITPAVTAAINRLAFDPDLHQPFVNEYMVGFAKQLPGQTSLDLAFTRRYFRDGYAEIDINGIYPDGPGKPFGGFGRVDPNQGIVRQQTNARWSQVVLTVVEAIVAKNLSHNFRGVLSLTRQWQHIDGTWNPTDPARFIQPEAFPNNRDLSRHLFGNGDDNSLDGGGRESGVAYRPYSVRFAGQYFAPWNLRIGASYVIQAGGYVGPVLRQISPNDPDVRRFGPSRVTLANGTTQPNPLATTWRFAFATRGAGQVRNETARYLQLQIGREFTVGAHRLETTLGIYNVFNTGAHTQWNDGANIIDSPNYLARFNRHPPRQFQLVFTYRF